MKLNKSKVLLACVILSISLNVFAQEGQEGVEIEDKSQPKTAFEVGGTLGTPAGLNLHLGYWSSVLLRLSGMHWGKSLFGAQSEVGWVFDREGKAWQYLSLAALTMRASGQSWTAAGVAYGLNASGFSLQLGLSWGTGSFQSPQALLQIGYSGLIGRSGD